MERLDSWKEIASYLKRQVRTVQLWEKTEGLPVHRHLHSKSGTVYAYASELDAWWRTRSPEGVPGSRLHYSENPAPVFRRGRPKRLMIAVLPFENLSRDEEQEYFSDGLTEEMISKLGRLNPERLGVIARTSAMHYKGTQKSIAEISEELGVGYVLEGSVRRCAGRVRITAQLIQASDQTHLWSESFDRDLTDVFAVQTEVANRIARSLTLELLPTEKAAILSNATRSSEAHEAYLRGRHFWNQRTESSLECALEHFQDAVRLDPDFALAYAGLADTHILLSAYGPSSPADGMPEAKNAATKALALDPTLGEAHASLGDIHMNFDWDWDAARAEYQQAIYFNPSYATAYHWYANFLGAMGEHDRALEQITLAADFDPHSLVILTWTGVVHSYAGNYQEAIRCYQQALDMDGNFVLARWMLGRAYDQQQRFAEAICELSKAAALSKGSPRILSALGHVLGRSGNTQGARAVLDQLRALMASRYVPAYDVAIVHLGLGQLDAAMEWLHRSVDERVSWLSLLKVDHRFDGMRHLPSFRELLRRVGLPLHSE